MSPLQQSVLAPQGDPDVPHGKQTPDEHTSGLQHSVLPPQSAPDAPQGVG